MKAKVVRFTESLDDPEAFSKRAVEFIQENVGRDERAICALSGGTDSSTVAMLFQRAIGERLYPIHIDTGFMRLIGGEEEPELVAGSFEDLDNFELIDRRDVFYENVFGIEDAEEKRRTFRRTYVDVLNQKIEEIGASVMTQGTIKPDVLETEGEIKSQNNVDTDFEIERLVEPLAGLYKPEVRMVCESLGLPESVYRRQPFLGPGLSARTVGRIDREKLETERKANDLVEGLVEGYFQKNYGRKSLWDGRSGDRIPFQYFAATFGPGRGEFQELDEYLKELGVEAKAWRLEERATGVREEDGERSRVYAPPVLLEGDMESELLAYLGREIPVQFDASRVLYKLEESDDGKWIVVIRAVRSKDAMTAEPLNIPIEDLREFGGRIVEGTDAGVVACDLTPKPPATIEYE